MIDTSTPSIRWNRSAYLDAAWNERVGDNTFGTLFGTLIGQNHPVIQAALDYLDHKTNNNQFFDQWIQRIDELDWDSRSLSHHVKSNIQSFTQLDRVPAPIADLFTDLLTGNSQTAAWVGNAIDDGLNTSDPSEFLAKLPNSAEAEPVRSRSASNLSLLKTVSTFDLNTDLKSSSRFYNLPYPTDLRLDAEGEPDLSAFPIGNPAIMQPLKNIASDRPGFPTTSAGYFRFNLPIAPQNPDRLIPAQKNSPILLIDIDPDSPERGKLFPVVAATPRPDLNYVPSFMLSVAPYPGIVLHPDRTYVYVVQRSLKDALGQTLETPTALKDLMNGRTPDGELGQAARRLYRPLWQTLDRIGLDRNSVAAATVFTTGDVVNDLEDLSQQVLDRYDLEIEGLQLDPVDGASHPDFYELHGTIRFPQFQQGTPPFNNNGLFAFDQTGQLIEQRTEVAPVVITIPKSPMSGEGYPLMVYYHGSDGLSTQVVDRGLITTPGGEPTPGRGPAFVVAQEGIAAAASALPLNPERLPGGPSEAYLNLRNLAAYRDTFRQGVLEQRLLLEALDELEIPASVFSGYSAPSMPVGETSYQLDALPTVVLGQSHGAQYAHMMAAIEPMIQGVVPTGSPGFWSLLLSQGEISPVIGLLLGTLQPLNFLYPGLHLLQTAWEAADPIAYAPRIAKNPLPNHPARSIYQPVGLGDTEVPQAVFNAIALATGVEQAGEILWSSMQTSLALEGFDGIVPYPVANNLVSQTGDPYTGTIVQFAGDGIANPHTIFSQLDAVKYQYRRFFKTLLTTGVARVPAPILR